MDDLSARVSEAIVRTFGPFRLFPARQLLLADGMPVKLGGRGFALLNLLVERHGELVTKRELMEAAWPDTFVHESNLKVNMSALRKALGGKDGRGSYIATVSGRGYRFIAPAASKLDLPASHPAIPPRLKLPPIHGMIGRQEKISDIAFQLRQGMHVTIVGTGGVGKTTLASAAAHAMEPDFPDGICWVDLSLIDDPMLVASALVAALGLRGDAPDRLAAAIDFLNRRRILVVIDNCEHVLPAVALLAGRLGLNCMSRILATSRMPLGTATEQIVWLEPLEAPPAGISLTTQTVTLYPAVQLLLQRSFDWSGYELIDEDCSAIAELCRRLDGIPLAIELAAGKLGQHSARELLELLGEHLEVLKRDEDGIPPRQQTLRATVDWSYRLLTRDEAAMFEVVSVFAGSFDATDAAVAAAAIGLGPAEAAASLGSLVSKSLVSATADRQELSYRLLDTTRQYALDRLKQHSRRRMVFMAHAERMVDLFERSEREWEWREAPEWAAFYQVRLPDLRKALAWSFDEEGDVQLGIRLAIAAIPVLFEISAISEARRIAETALCLEVSDVQRMKLSSSRAWSMLYGRGRELESEGAWHAAIDAAKRCGNADYHLRSLLGYCFYLNGSGQLPRALERLVEFRELARHNPQSPSAADGERFFALVSGYLGDVREAKRILDRLALNAPNLGQRSRMAGFQVDRYIGTRNYLSFISWLAGDPAYAARMAEEGINAAGQLDHLVSQSNVLAISGLPVAFWNGDEKVFAAYTAKLQANLEIEGTELWKPLLQWYRALLPEMRGGSADVETMLDVTTELIETHFTIRIGFYLGVLAETLASHGRLDEANVQLKKAFDYQDRQSERWCLPELRRIQASISRRRGNMHEAESLLGMALEEAHAIGAASFELRAATDLASLQLEANQPCKAAQLLMPIHRRFSENTVTKDLVAATEILHRASHMG